MLDRTRLQGDLQLADGVMGTEHGHLVLADRALGRNGIALTASVLGHRLVVHWPELAASGAVFDLRGSSVRTGPVTAALDAHVTGLSGLAAETTVKIHHMTVRDVALGSGAEAAGAAATTPA
jgi:hypothetical protein